MRMRSPFHRTILPFLHRFIFFQFIMAVGSNPQVRQHEGRQTRALRIARDSYIQMRSGVPFKICLFADLHYGEAAWTEWGPAQDLNSTKVMSSVLDEETPGEEGFSFKGTHRLELMKKEIEQNTLSHSENGPKDLWPSISNYVLKISSSDDPKSPVVFLYFLDSGGGSYPQVVSSSQAQWFLHKSQEINPDSRVPELIFWHIPSEAYDKVAPKFGISKPCVGSINKESVAAQQAELGIMNLLAKRPSVKAVCCPYKELWLCFARHTGYGGYGDWARGARILEITQHPFSLKSWIRMEDGHLHSEIIFTN